MFLRVQELQLRKLSIAEVFPPGAVDFFDAWLRQISNLEVTGSAELRGVTMEILIRGRFCVRMEADCDRCLEAVVFPIAAEFDLVYRPLPAASAQEVILSDEETEVGFYRGAGLELADVLREQVLLALPMQRLCRPECRGICPFCGQNRNSVSCGCRSRWQDDRWAALREL